jgi:hypothetical protein
MSSTVYVSRHSQGKYKGRRRRPVNRTIVLTVSLLFVFWAATAVTGATAAAGMWSA